MANIKISCIIPVYNSEKFLRRAVQSIMQQSFRDIEIICVNDASTDGSLKLLKELSEEDPRMIIIDSQENKGAAAARNMGLDRARGEYIIFLDSDDYFFPNMLEEAYKMTMQYDCDVVLFGFEHTVIKEDTEEILSITKKVYPFQIMEKGNRHWECLWTIRPVVWNKLIKKSYLDSYGIRFQEIKTDEDIFFAMAVYLSADRMVVSDQILLRYFFSRDNSISQYRRKKKSIRVYAYEELLQYLKNKEIEPAIEKEIYNHMTYKLEFDLDEAASPEVKKDIAEVIYQNTFFAEKLKKAYDEGLLCSQARIFAEKLFAKKGLVETEFYEYYMPGIEKKFLDSKASGKKLALWGCGRLGKEIVNGMNAKEFAFDHLIDMNPKKKGTSYAGYQIEQYEDIKDDVDMILVTISDYQAYKEIKEMAGDKEVYFIYTM